MKFAGPGLCLSPSMWPDPEAARGPNPAAPSGTESIPYWGGRPTGASLWISCLVGGENPSACAEGVTINNGSPSCGSPGLSTCRNHVRQPFSRLCWLPRAVVIGLASTVVPISTQRHRRVPRTTTPALNQRRYPSARWRHKPSQKPTTAGNLHCASNTTFISKIITTPHPSTPFII